MLKWSKYISTIYANDARNEYIYDSNKNLYSQNTIKNYTNKPDNINNELIKMNTSPFVVYIDDDNKIIGAREIFTTYLGKYINNDINTSKSLDNIVKLLEIKDNTLNLHINTNYNCMFIALPYESTGIINDNYYDKIKKYLQEIKKKYKNNILVICDFDCTLTTRHLFKTLHKKDLKVSNQNLVYAYFYEYILSKLDNTYNFDKWSDTYYKAQIINFFGTEREKMDIKKFSKFTNIELNKMFESPDYLLKNNTNPITISIIEKGSAVKNVKKIEDLFDIIKSDTIQESTENSSSSFCDKIKSVNK